MNRVQTDTTNHLSCIASDGIKTSLFINDRFNNTIFRYDRPASGRIFSHSTEKF